MNRLATPDEVADWLQISAERLSYLRKVGTGPHFIKVGRDVRYAWTDVHTWCNRNRTAQTGSADA